MIFITSAGWIDSDLFYYNDTRRKHIGQSIQWFTQVGVESLLLDFSLSCG